MGNGQLETTDGNAPSNSPGSVVFGDYSSGFEYPQLKRTIHRMREQGRTYPMWTDTTALLKEAMRSVVVDGSSNRKSSPMLGPESESSLPRIG
ncbi:MAG: hypothetical protein Q9224_001929 [Gallowayella concinna]